MDKQERKKVKPEKIKHWKLKQPPYQIGIDEFTNKDKEEKQDIDGWVPASYCRPLLFDLVKAKMADEKTKNGWWNGYHWEGYRIKAEDDVLYWKPIRDENF